MYRSAGRPPLWWGNEEKTFGTIFAVEKNKKIFQKVLDT